MLRADRVGVAIVWLAIAAILVSLAMTTLAQIAGAAETPAVQAPLLMPGVEKYFPDRWAPEPRQPDQQNYQRTIYAEKIVLQGPECTIVIDATGRGPGVAVTARRTGQTAYVALNSLGVPVVGVGDPREEKLTAAFYSNRGVGVFQLRDQGGTHVWTGGELESRPSWRSTGLNSTAPVRTVVSGTVSYPVQPVYYAVPSCDSSGCNWW